MGPLIGYEHPSHAGRGRKGRDVLRVNGPNAELGSYWIESMKSYWIGSMNMGLIVFCSVQNIKKREMLTSASGALFKHFK